VTTGGEAEDFSFEGGEARLGRTADNDIVIKDPSSSRSHARVYEEDGRFFVEDLKSANGTKLNGKAVKAPLELKSGDRVTIGDVILEFAAPDGNDTMMQAPSSTVDDAADGGSTGEDGEDPNSTMLKPPPAKVAAMVRKPPPRRAPDPEPEEPQDEEPPPDDAEDDAASANSTKNFEVPPPRALQRKGAAAPARPSRPVRGGDAEGEEPVQLTAAERARQRRALAQSTSGRAQLLWSDLSLPAKIVVGGIGGIAVVAILAFAVMAVIPKKTRQRIEVMELQPNGDPLPDAFGLGDDVDFEKSDMKSFTFQYDSPTSIVGVLHYQARDCSKDEVSIELNGNALTTIPPDTVDSSQRQLEQVLPATQLKVTEPNELVFDNANNPPADDPWRVWNVWVEVIPIPNMSAEEASRRAKQDIERAAGMYDSRDIGAMNLFRSWKSYRDAWLLLEATPDRSKELLEIARTRMREIRPELDRKCTAMLLDYQKEMAKKDPNFAAARKVLQNIPSHFEKEHWCYGASRGALRSMDDLNVQE
jgi:hypothetical protein